MSLSKEYIQELEKLEAINIALDGFQAAIAKMNEPKQPESWEN